MEKRELNPVERERSYQLFIQNLEIKIKKLEEKIKQLELINHDALLRNVEMANELREYQSRNKYTELKRNATTNDI